MSIVESIARGRLAVQRVRAALGSADAGIWISARYLMVDILPSADVPMTAAVAVAKGGDLPSVIELAGMSATSDPMDIRDKLLAAHNPLADNTLTDIVDDLLIYWLYWLVLDPGQADEILRIAWQVGFLEEMEEHAYIQPLVALVFDDVPRDSLELVSQAQGIATELLALLGGPPLMYADFVKVPFEPSYIS